MEVTIRMKSVKTLLHQGISESYFMVIQFIDSKELLETLILVINSNANDIFQKSLKQHVFCTTVCMSGCNNGLKRWLLL